MFKSQTSIKQQNVAKSQNFELMWQRTKNVLSMVWAVTKKVFLWVKFISYDKCGQNYRNNITQESELKMWCKEKIARDEDIQDEKNEYPFLFPFQITEKESLSIDEMLCSHSLFPISFQSKKMDVSHIMTSHVKYDNSKKLHLFWWREICYLLDSKYLEY